MKIYPGTTLEKKRSIEKEGFRFDQAKKPTAHGPPLYCSSAKEAAGVYGKGLLSFTIDPFRVVELDNAKLIELETEALRRADLSMAINPAADPEEFRKLAGEQMRAIIFERGFFGFSYPVMRDRYNFVIYDFAALLPF